MEKEHPRPKSYVPGSDLPGGEGAPEVTREAKGVLKRQLTEVGSRVVYATRRYFRPVQNFRDSITITKELIRKTKGIRKTSKDN